MLALLTALAMFAYAGVIGYALVVVTVKDRGPMFLLVSPAIGVALIALPTMLLNYLGAPVRDFGAALAVMLLIASAAVLLKSRAHVVPRSLYGVAAVLAGAVVLTGRPFFEFGFDWLSVVNDDMNTYVFGAARMFEHGFLGGPSLQAYVQNRTVIESFYALDVLYNNRTGVENVIAFWMAALRLDGYHTYMPLIFSLQLTLISAAAGLAASRTNDARVPVATALALTVSPLTTLGTDLQLIAQVCGLALMAASLALICSSIPEQRGEFARRCCLCAVPAAALAAVYPEIVPLLGIAVVAYFSIAVAQKADSAVRALAWLSAITVVAALLLNVHLSTFLEMASIIFSFGQGAGLAPSAFPYYLLPNGLADLFGIIPVSTPVSEPALSLAIIIGIVLFCASLVGTLYLMVRREAAAFGSFALLIIIPLLVRHQNGFALYKLAMYLQPFLIPTLVLWWASWPPFVQIRRREPVHA